MSGLGGPGGRGGPGGPVTLTHAEAEALISARLDGPLDPVANRTLLAHLAGCPSCRAFASRMEVMTRGFRELPLLPASPTVSREVRQRVAAGRSPWDRLGSALGGGRLGPMPAAVGALVLVAALAFVIIFRGGDDNRPPGVGAPSSTVSGMNATPTPEPTETGTTGSESTPTVRVVNTPTPTPEAPTATATLPANVNATVTPTPTPTEEPATATAEPTQTPEPTETATPEPTETATPEPTETPTEEPSATATATEEPSPTATEEPTEEPTLTPTEDPTAAPTEEPTAEPTETATEQPTETPTEEPTQTPEPTSTPTEERTETPEPTETAEPTETPTPTPTEEPTETATPEATPTAEPTEEPTEEPTPTQPGIQPREGTTPIPVDDTGEGEFETQADEPTEEVVEEPTEEPTEEATQEEGSEIEQRGGDDGEEQTAEPDAEETPPPADEETPETEETQQGGQGGGAADLADGETDVDLPGGAAAPPGPLLLDPAAERFVFLDGGSLAIANRGTGETAVIGAGFWPSWSTLGNNVLYAASAENGTAVVSWDRDNGAYYDITAATNSDGRPVSDAPAGWIESQIYFVRSYADQPGRLELHRTEFDGREDTILWESDNAVLAGERPFATPSGVLIPTDGGWVLADGGGGAVIDSVTYAPGGAYEVLGSSIAYQSGGEVIVAPVGAPGQGVVLPGGDGFAWSPDGTQLVVIDGGSLSIYTTGGELVGSVANDSGIQIAAPQWTSDGILYLDLANAVVRRLPVEAFFG